MTNKAIHSNAFTLPMFPEPEKPPEPMDNEPPGNEEKADIPSSRVIPLELERSSTDAQSVAESIPLIPARWEELREVAKDRDVFLLS